METRKELMKWANGEAILDCASWYVNDLIGAYIQETADYDGGNEAWDIYAERAELPEDWEA